MCLCANLSYNVTYVSSFVMNSIMWYFVKCLLISFFYRTKFIYVYLWISKRFHSVVIMIHVYVVAVTIDDHSLCKQISVVKKTPHGLFYTLDLNSIAKYLKFFLSHDFVKHSINGFWLGFLFCFCFLFFWWLSKSILYKTKCWKLTTRLM